MSARATNVCGAGDRGPRRNWSLERVLFAMAGSVVLLGALLSALVSSWFLLLIAFVGVSQWLYVVVGHCPASLILTRLFDLQRGASS